MYSGGPDQIKCTPFAGSSTTGIALVKISVTSYLAKSPYYSPDPVSTRRAISFTHSLLHRTPASLDVARKAEVHGQHSSHGAALRLFDRHFLHVEVAIGTVRNHGLPWFKAELNAVELYRNDIGLE